jgi:hypothetical protein
MDAIKPEEAKIALVALRVAEKRRVPGIRRCSASGDRLPDRRPRQLARAATAYLVPWFNGGCPWTMEYACALI